MYKDIYNVDNLLRIVYGWDGVWWDWGWLRYFGLYGVNEI